MKHILSSYTIKPRGFRPEIKVSRMTSGRYIVHDGDIPLSGIKGQSRSVAYRIAARLRSRQ